MIIVTHELKTLTKHVSCECKCKFDRTKCKSNQWRNNDRYWWKCKKHISEKDYVWNPATCMYKNRKYLASIMDDLAIICDEVIVTQWRNKS